MCISTSSGESQAKFLPNLDMYPTVRAFASRRVYLNTSRGNEAAQEQELFGRDRWNACGRHISFHVRKPGEQNAVTARADWGSE